MNAIQFIKQVDRIFILDFETSGLVSTYDYITQIGAVVMENGQVIDSFSDRITLEGTKAKVSLEALAVQAGKQGNVRETVEKYLDLMFSGKPKAEVFGRFYEWALKNEIVDLPVVGQNTIYFDSGFLSKLVYECRKITGDTQVVGPLWIDTKDLFKRLYPNEGAGLDAICERLGIEKREGGHDALQDCILTGLAFFKMQELLGGDQ